MTTWVDPLGQDLNQRVMRAISDEDAFEAISSSLWNKVAAPPAVGRDASRLRGIEAWHALERLNRRLELLARRLARRHAPAEWIWYLRRVPDLFSLNELESTGEYCDRIASALARYSRKEATPLRLPTLAYPVDNRAVESLVRMHVAVSSLYELHSACRWAGKGAEIVFQAGRRPTWEPSHELAEAVHEYDRRLHLSPLSRTGLFMDPNILRSPQVEWQGLPLVARLAEPTAISLPEMEGVVAETVFGRFVVGSLDLGDYQLLSNPQVPSDIRWPPQMLAAVALLTSYLLHIAENPNAMVTLAHVGYLAANERLVRQRVASALHFLDDERMGGLIDDDVRVPDEGACMRILSNFESRIWPPAVGRPIVPAGRDGAVLVDLAGASGKLLDSMNRPTGIDGHIGNIWGSTFEEQIQSIIDETSWIPHGNLRELIGRTLRLDGRQVSDIDALAVKDDVLLLIDAKSRPYTDAYDRGEYRAVRANAEHADSAADDWETFLAILRSHPIGDNYDLRGFKNICGCVVYPFLPFTDSARARSDAMSGLKRICSATELHTALS